MSFSDSRAGGDVLRVGDLTTEWGLSGMNSATSRARITRIAPKANGGPGIIVYKDTNKD